MISSPSSLRTLPPQHPNEGRLPYRSKAPRALERRAKKRLSDNPHARGDILSAGVRRRSAPAMTAGDSLIIPPRRGGGSALFHHSGSDRVSFDVKKGMPLLPRAFPFTSESPPCPSIFCQARPTCPWPPGPPGPPPFGSIPEFPRTLKENDSCPP